MSDNNSVKKNNSDNTKWVSLAVVVAVLLFSSFFFSDNSPIRVNKTTFFPLAQKKDTIKSLHFAPDAGIGGTARLCITLTPNGINEYKGLITAQRKASNKGNSDEILLPSDGHHLELVTTLNFLRDEYPDLQSRINDLPFVEVQEISSYDRLMRFAFSYRLISLLITLLIFFYLFMSSGLGFERKNTAKLWDKKNKTGVTFKDIKGMVEAKEQLRDMVNFFKHPKLYERLGATPPKGALLVGPPGTGKTLLARALAGEAGVSFLSISGSDFEEVFVGVGAQRIRDLFAQARKKNPCIIFIDEIDTFGQKRSRQSSGFRDDSATLNQFLSEMDGFSPSSGIFVIASTNRPDVLDSALTRSGRLGRIVYTSYPTVKEREAAFEYYTQKVKSSSKISLKELAWKSSGFSYADIRETCNSAALIAVNKKHSYVEPSDFYEAINEQIGGVVRKESILKPKEKKIVAYHEVGHALVAHALPNTDPLVSVTIMPRTNAALGFAQFENGERNIHQKSWFKDKLASLLGGKAAEEVVFEESSTGSQNDLERSTGIAHDMVSIYGMNEKIGHVSYYGSTGSNGYYGKRYSEKLAEKMDVEVKKILQDSYKKATAILTLHRDVLERVAQALMKKEEMTAEEFVKAVGYTKEKFVEVTTAGLAPKKRVIRKKKEEKAEPAVEGDAPEVK